MLQSMLTALSGMKAQQTCIDVTGNNIANINTTAFKGSRTDFADLLYAQMKRPLESGDYLQNGSGLAVAAVQRLMAQGNPVPTGGTLDFMIDGQGYFTLQGPDGQRYYTRDGSFKAAEMNGGNWLVSSEGLPVLGSNNQPIQIPGDTTALGCDSLGNLAAGGVPFASLGIARFPNPSGLLDAGGNKCLPSDASGAAAASAGYIVRQGSLEGSNVDMAGDMTRIIRAQRAFSVMGSAVRTADEMESVANNLTR